jgi:cytochrome oxidase assembly protein ShyY1
MNATQLTYSKGTISIALVHEALHTAQQRGMDTHAILQTAGIPAELLHSNKARVSILQYGQLWIALAAMLCVVAVINSCLNGCTKQSI